MTVLGTRPRKNRRGRAPSAPAQHGQPPRPACPCHARAPQGRMNRAVKGCAMAGLSEARGLAVLGCLPCTALGDFCGVCEWLGAVSRSGGPWGGAPARLVVRLPTGFGQGCQRVLGCANGLWAGLQTSLRGGLPTRLVLWRPTSHWLCGAP